jgi:hypothetical protein
LCSYHVPATYNWYAFKNKQNVAEEEEAEEIQESEAEESEDESDDKPVRN